MLEVAVSIAAFVREEEAVGMDSKDQNVAAPAAKIYCSSFHGKSKWQNFVLEAIFTGVYLPLKNKYLEMHNFWNN